jgi:large exoprotein involved in heme utilization and adhesion
LNLRDNPASITSQASDDIVLEELNVPPGATLALVGGNISLDQWYTQAPGSNIELGGLTETGTVNIEEDGSLSFPDGVERGDVSLANSFISVESGGGGSITVNARNFELISTFFTAGIGFELGSAEAQAGDIVIDATEDVLVSDDGFISNELNGIGKAGNIEIAARNISFSNGSQVSDFFSLGSGDLGDVILNARENISFDGESSGILIAPFNNENSIINPGTIDITAQNLSLSNDAGISSSSDGGGNGNAGSITIRAMDSVELSGSNQIFTNVNKAATGNGGDIAIQTGNLTASDGSIIGAVTFGKGDSGNINIETGKLSVDSAIISNSTFGNGDAGSLKIRATDSVQLAKNSVILADVQPGATGDGGDITIETGNLTAGDGSRIGVSTLGDGNGGNLTVEANSIRLDNNSSINAATQSGNGGNITLEVADNLTLRNNRSISAQAFKNADGGNINIDAGFVVALPSKGDGSDIIASAAQKGAGGNIDINAQQIFGLEERKEVENNNTNDIDASSRFGISGNVNINNLVSNPIQGTVELPVNPVEPGETVTETCSGQGGSGQENGLTIKGKGGMAPEPIEPFSGEAFVGAAATSNSNDNSHEQVYPKAIATSVGNIVPARGVVINKNGKVSLVAYPTNGNQRAYTEPTSCGKS